MFFEFWVENSRGGSEEIIDLGSDGRKDLGELSVLFGGEFGEHEIGVVEILAKIWVIGAEAKTGKISGSEVLNSRFETIVTAIAALIAITSGAEGDIEVVAKNE